MNAAFRGLLSLLLVVAMGHGVLHTHEVEPDRLHQHVVSDSHGSCDHHGHEDGKEVPADEQDHGHPEAPCQTCILLAGLDLPSVAPLLAPPAPVAVALEGTDESAPASHLAWSHRLLRGPPSA